MALELAWTEIATSTGKGATCRAGGMVAMLLPVKMARITEGYQLWLDGRLETQLIGVSLRRARTESDRILRARYPHWFRAEGERPVMPWDRAAERSRQRREERRQGSPASEPEPSPE